VATGKATMDAASRASAKVFCILFSCQTRIPPKGGT
jgi:hypothetical protein